MNDPIHRFVVLALLSSSLIGISLSSSAEDSDITREKIEAALAAESRPKEDRARDKNRKPVETLLFLVFVACGSGAGWILWFSPSEDPPPGLRRRLALLATGCLLSFATLLALISSRISPGA